MGIRLAPQVPMWVSGDLNPHTKSPNERGSMVHIRSTHLSIPVCAKQDGEGNEEDNKPKRVMVLAATNFPWDIDEAMRCVGCVCVYGGKEVCWTLITCVRVPHVWPQAPPGRVPPGWLAPPNDPTPKA
eukprot:366148-Chlamydomonas_euryale.AAC.1